ncbi:MULTISPECIES: ATP-binding cassette domain-containing protein [Pseudomonas]|jgi:putative thiamine transport system ATP-binding protein|uniref:ATP-binding cassette domain-containing protein n=2 Tax=Pseudomonas TaxID=286 RepID=A0A7X1GIT9_9PSED|nr:MULTISPECIES: ATP-binding cassette domain-containing protein [Pseudomonas]KRP86575.1 ABC transporter ATP-binding protein [Pseudomonas lactis]MBC2693272.1 ATP-binding cassette domain-containing protein [Pseudomonas kielensis]MDD1010323.1 ATP-binding cassette domain-containing protein [Pseudomonas shahriarae]
MNLKHHLELRNIKLSILGQTLLSLNQTIGPGESLTVMGPSGSGKSSLLAFIAGFLPAEFQAAGQVILDGHDITGVPAERSGVGLLFQDPLLFPHLSVAGNVRFGIRGGGREVDREVNEALAEVGLEGFGMRDPETLSGGQRARVALVRLLLSRPRAVLLDEPFSKLDAILRAEMRSLVFDHLRDYGVPTILVTHDAADAKAADGILIKLRAR